MKTAALTCYLTAAERLAVSFLLLTLALTIDHTPASLQERIATGPPPVDTRPLVRSGSTLLVRVLLLFRCAFTNGSTIVAHQVAERFNQLLRDRPGLPGADRPSIHLHHRNHLRP